VLSNLIGNSIKFTPAGGHVTIRASYAEQNARVEVIDNGIGIASDNLDKIFEKFYQVDSSATRAAGGMGMGLPIARELIELHGGKLWAESEGTGKGSRFIFTLPVV
jgi:histidine kinase